MGWGGVGWGGMRWELRTAGRSLGMIYSFRMQATELNQYCSITSLSDISLPQ